MTIEAISLVQDTLSDFLCEAVSPPETAASPTVEEEGLQRYTVHAAVTVLEVFSKNIIVLIGKAVFMGKVS